MEQKQRHLIIVAIAILIVVVSVVIFILLSTKQNNIIDSQPVENNLGTNTSAQTENVEQVQGDGSMNNKEEVIELSGTEKYPAGWTEGLTRQQIVDRINQDADDQALRDGTVILGGSTN